MRHAGLRDYDTRKKRLERWLEQHRRALINLELCADNEKIVLRFPNPTRRPPGVKPCSHRKAHGEHIYSSNNPYRGSLGSVFGYVDDDLLMKVYDADAVKQLRDMDEDARRFRLRLEEAGKLWINAGRNPGEGDYIR